MDTCQQEESDKVSAKRNQHPQGGGGKKCQKCITQYVNDPLGIIHIYYVSIKEKVGGLKLLSLM